MEWFLRKKASTQQVLPNCYRTTIPKLTLKCCRASENSVCYPKMGQKIKLVFEAGTMCTSGDFFKALRRKSKMFFLLTRAMFEHFQNCYIYISTLLFVCSNYWTHILCFLKLAAFRSPHVLLQNRISIIVPMDANTGASVNNKCKDHFPYFNIHTVYWLRTWAQY